MPKKSITSENAQKKIMNFFTTRAFLFEYNSHQVLQYKNSYYNMKM